MERAFLYLLIGFCAGTVFWMLVPDKTYILWSFAFGYAMGICSWLIDMGYHSVTKT